MYAPVAGIARRSPRARLRQLDAVDEDVARLAVLAGDPERPRRRLVGPVREQRRVARAVELRSRVVRHPAVDRDPGDRLAHVLHGADAVQRHARRADDRAPGLEDQPRARKAVRGPRPFQPPEQVADEVGDRRWLVLVRRGADAEPAAEVDDLRRPAELVAAARRELGEPVDGEARRASRRGAASRCARGARAAARARSARAPARAGGRTSSRAGPVRIASCVSASTPSVSRTSVRVTPAARARSTSSRASSTTSAPAAPAAASSASSLLLPWTTSASPPMPACCAKRSSPSVETSAPSPSSASRRITETFGNAFVP